VIGLDVLGLSVQAPGLAGWEQALPILRGEQRLDPDATLALPAPALLAANERRRAGLPVRLALAVCEAATRMAGLVPGEAPCVFGSSNGDGAVVHELLETLAGPDPALSPTRFHNSVHNAVAGYWSIATGSRAPVTCLGCHDATVAASLLKAAAEAVATGGPVLLCLYDAPMQPPLGALRVTTIGFACALLLTPAGTRREALPAGRIAVGYAPGGAEAEPAPLDEGLRALWSRNPVARALVLLEAIAREARRDLCFPYGGGRLLVRCG